MILEQLLLSLVTTLLLVTAAITQQDTASCASGWTLIEGVRRSGDFVCEKAPPITCGEPTGPYENVPCPPAPRYGSKIYCTGGAEPVIDDDGRTVGCQRVHR